MTRTDLFEKEMNEQKLNWYAKKKALLNPICEDCGTPKGLRGTRCKSCQAKIRTKKFPPPSQRGKHYVVKEGHKIYG